MRQRCGEAGLRVLAQVRGLMNVQFASSDNEVHLIGQPACGAYRTVSSLSHRRAKRESRRRVMAAGNRRPSRRDQQFIPPYYW